MSAMKKPVQKFSLNCGELSVSLNERGDVIEEDGVSSHVELTAAQLDAIAETSASIERIAKQLTGDISSIPSETRVAGHEIKFQVLENLGGDLDYVNGDVKFGCQLVEAKDVARIHKASLAIRSRNKK